MQKLMPASTKIHPVVPFYILVNMHCTKTHVSPQIPKKFLTYAQSQFTKYYFCSHQF